MTGGTTFLRVNERSRLGPVTSGQKTTLDLAVSQLIGPLIFIPSPPNLWISIGLSSHLVLSFGPHRLRFSEKDIADDKSKTFDSDRELSFTGCRGLLFDTKLWTKITSVVLFDGRSRLGNCR